MISDGLSHWSDIFLWRHHHYEAIISAYDAQHDQVFDTIELHGDFCVLHFLATSLRNYHHYIFISTLPVHLNRRLALSVSETLGLLNYTAKNAEPAAQQD
jgi:hypothetical protein